MSAEAMLPLPYRVVERRVETPDSATLRLEPVGEALPPFSPGQFTMLYARGIGEIAISISGDPYTGDGTLTQTIRDVGAVSRALHAAEPGSVIGVRGPYGVGWDVDSAVGKDVVIVAGGVGLAPLRPVLLGVMGRRESFGRLTLIAGARKPTEFLFRDQLDDWVVREDLELDLTVDVPARGWFGGVGFVTEPLAQLSVQPDKTVAFVCGPEPMMRFSAEVLVRKGVSPRDIRVSLERNMKCGVGLCGHCQLGPVLVCRDGPVMDYSHAAPLLKVGEL